MYTNEGALRARRLPVSFVYSLRSHAAGVAYRSTCNTCTRRTSLPRCPCRTVRVLSINYWIRQRVGADNFNSSRRSSTPTRYADASVRITSNTPHASSTMSCQRINCPPGTRYIGNCFVLCCLTRDHNTSCAHPRIQLASARLDTSTTPKHLRLCLCKRRCGTTGNSNQLVMR